MTTFVNSTNYAFDMKRFLSFLAILGLILTQACKPDQPSEASLSVNPKSLSFAAEGGTQTISVTAGQAWTVAPEGLTGTLESMEEK